MARILKWIVAVFLIFGLIQGVLWWDSRADGFALSKIESNLPVEARWNINPAAEQYEKALSALSQPYTYLAHGFQCYAFESADKQYVLKFFRHQRLRLPDFVMKLPAMPIFEEWRTTRIMSLNRRREYLMRSCKTAQEHAAYETGLIFTHLNMTKNLFPTVEITDKIGRTYQVSLDDCQFIVQYKAEHIKPTFKKLVQEGKLDEAKLRIKQIFDLLATCAKRGVQDNDNALIYKNNIGFLPDRAIYIDGGKLVLKKVPLKKDRFVKDLNRLKPLLRWMKEETPGLVPYFRDAEQQAINSY